MSIALIRPSYESVYSLYRSKAHSKLVHPPLGLMYLAATLEAHGFRVAIIDAEVDGLGIDQILERIEIIDPILVGVGATTPEYETAVEILREIKARTGRKTVIGGPHATILPQDVLERAPEIDFLVRGEGEHTMLELSNRVRKNNNDREKLSNIDGLSWRQGDRIFHNKERQPIAELDELPPPARHLIDQKKYMFSIPGVGMRPMSVVQTQRGCLFKCIYCYRMFGNSVRYRSPQAVVEEIEDIVAGGGIQWISFVDDTFTLNRAKVVQICDEIINRGLRFKWFCLARADTIDRELVLKMKEAGCAEISMGVESGNQSILDLIKKGTKLEQYREDFKMLKECGYETRGSFIIGLPYETSRTIRDTINFAKSLDLDIASFNIATPYPGTAFFEMASNGKGARLLSRNWSEFKRWGNAVIELETVSRSELIEWQKTAIKEFHLQPKILLYNLKRFLKGEHDKFFYRPLLFALGKLLRQLRSSWLLRRGDGANGQDTFS